MVQGECTAPRLTTVLRAAIRSSAPMCDALSAAEVGAGGTPVVFVFDPLAKAEATSRGTELACELELPRRPAGAQLEPTANRLAESPVPLNDTDNDPWPTCPGAWKGAL
jgi:hypothetical protein